MKIKFEDMMLGVMSYSTYLTHEEIRDKIMIAHGKYYQPDTIRRKINRIATRLEWKSFNNVCGHGSHHRWRKAK